MRQGQERPGLRERARVGCFEQVEIVKVELSLLGMLAVRARQHKQ